MKVNSKAQREHQDGDILASFIDVDETPVVIVDRSTLEHFATCPQQGYLILHKQASHAGHAANVGEAVHQAFSDVTLEYIQSRGNMNQRDLVNTLTNALFASRPDVQPDAIDAAKYSVWEWSKFIASVNVENILRFDGGEDIDRSGQLAVDVRLGGTVFRITSEIDLLHAGPSKKLLHEIDYKSGAGRWTASNAADAFQFQLHWLLVADSYPDVDALEVSVWNTRANRRTYSVEFTRTQLGQIRARVMSAVGMYYQYHNDQGAPCWPASDKCAFCDAAALCPCVSHAQKTLEESPEQWVASMVAIKKKLDAMTKLASAHVAKTGADIVTPKGDAFGYRKPKAARKVPTALYRVEDHQDEEEE